MLLLRTVASRYLIAFAICCSLLSVGAVWWMDILAAVHRTPLAIQPAASSSSTSQLAAELSKLPRRRINVAVASDFGFHYDVYLTLVGTMQRAMNGAGSFSVYAPLPLGFDFQTVVDKFGLYHGPPIQSFDALLSDLETSSVDLILIGTCEVECVRSIFPSLLLLRTLHNNTAYAIETKPYCRHGTPVTPRINLSSSVSFITLKTMHGRK